jgi:hypothetical protein
MAFYLCLKSIRTPLIRKVMVGAFVLLLIPGCLIVDPNAGVYPRGKRAWAQCYLVTESIPSCGKVFNIYSYPEQTHLKEKLDYLKENGLNLYDGY